MSRAGARLCAARTSSWRRPATCASRAVPSKRHVVLRMENRIVNLGAGPAELFGERVSLSEMRARQVVADAAGRRYRIVTGAELYFKSVPVARRVVLEVQGRRALRAVGHRPGRPAHDPGAHRAQARLLPARPRPRARRADRPAPALLRRLQPARGHAPDHAGDVGGLGRRLPVDLSRQLDRRHGLERLLRGRAPRRPGQRHLRVQRGQQRLVEDRAPALQARAAALPAQRRRRCLPHRRCPRPLRTPPAPAS